ncbi:MAG: CHASE2 domain-containing protein, partial [Bacillota bacterium]
MRRRALVALASGVAAALAQALGLFEPLELPLYDLRVGVRFMLGPASRAAEQIAVVAVDEQSLAQLGRWPWRRAVHARLLEQLSAASPLAVGFDLVLSEPSGTPDGQAGGQADDRALAEAARAVPGLVLPGGEEAPYPALAREAARLASIDFPVDRDGRIRRLPLPGSGDGRSSLTGAPLAVALVEVAARSAADPAHAGPGEPLRASLGSGHLEGQPVLWLDLRRPPVSRWPIRVEDLFPTFSYADVLSGRVRPDALTGRIVLVGVTAPGVVGSDRHLTALSALGPVPGVIVHANAVRALLDEGAVHRPGGPGPVP